MSRLAIFSGLVAAVWVCAASHLFAADTPPKSAEAATTLRLRGKSIVLDRTKGEVQIDGDVHVVRTTGDQVLTVDCEKLTAVLKEQRLESALATGNVKLVTADYTAAAARADLGFEKGLIKLYGDEKKPASVTSGGMASTGPEIVFYVNEQRVELPKGGDTVVDLNRPQTGAYTCPAHPDVASKDPGKCPKCGANLVRKPPA